MKSIGKRRMKSILGNNIFKAAIALLPVLPAAADYCTFENSNCIDGLAQVSVSFQFNAISPAPLQFYYGFDAGWGCPANEDESAVKLGYWLQYDKATLTDYNTDIRGVNWTTEVALRIGNLGGFVGSGNNGCDRVWGNTCSENLKTFLRSSIFNLSMSGQPYELPLDTVLRSLTAGRPAPPINGCPSTLFDLDQIPTYAVVNATKVDSGNASQVISVASPGNPDAPWRTWYVPGATAMGQAQEVAVGIIARGPNHGSKPLNGPDDIRLELVCARAPRQHHPPDGDGNMGPPGNSAPPPYARGFIKTYAFEEDEFIHEVKDPVQEEDVDDDNDDDEETPC